MSMEVIKQETHIKIGACIPNMIKFLKSECSKGLMFEPPMSFIPSISTSKESNKNAFCLLIYITDQKKVKDFLYNAIKLIDINVNVLTCCDLLLAMKEYLVGTTLKNQRSSSKGNQLSQEVVSE